MSQGGARVDCAGDFVTFDELFKRLLASSMGNLVRQLVQANTVEKVLLFKKLYDRKYIDLALSCAKSRNQYICLSCAKLNPIAEVDDGWIVIEEKNRKIDTGLNFMRICPACQPKVIKNFTAEFSNSLIDASRSFIGEAYRRDNGMFEFYSYGSFHSINSQYFLVEKPQYITLEVTYDLGLLHLCIQYREGQLSIILCQHRDQDSMFSAPIDHVRRLLDRHN